MNRILSAYGVFLLIVLITGCTLVDSVDNRVTPQEFLCDSSPEQNGFIPGRIAVLDSFYQNRVENKIMPNAVLFIARYGKVVYFQSLGYRNIENNLPVRKNDIFRIASQSKAITTAGLMILFEKGYFLMNDPVSKYYRV